MRQIDNELKNKQINYQSLLKYGFEKNNEKYIYKTKIYNDQFEIIVEIQNNKMCSKLMDLENEEEYILVDIQETSGEFIGKVRNEYEKLKEIIEKCTEKNIFKNKQSKEIINYIKEKYKDEPEYLWEKFENNAIWRNKKNNKWYGLILTVKESKIGIESEKEIEILDLRYQKEKIEQIVDNKIIFPGYHMNKKSWITIKLDNTLKSVEIFKLIDNSYNLVAGNKNGKNDEG